MKKNSLLIFGFVFFFLIIDFIQCVPRSRRQNCECQAGEAPRCGCQVMASEENGGGQMICTCAPSTPSRCVCSEGNMNHIITVPNMPSIEKSYKCSDSCQPSCLNSCNKLSFNLRCSTICAEACQFTCAKQEAATNTPNAAITTTNTPTTMTSILPTTTTMKPLPSNIQEYRFMIPAVKTTQTTTNQATCSSECQPSCNFVCTKLRPTLRIISQMFDSNTDEKMCRTNCKSACQNVCISSGIATIECEENCSPACQDTCTIVKKPTTIVSTTPKIEQRRDEKCFSICMPSCSSQCVFSVQMQMAFAQQQNTVMTSNEQPTKAVLIPIPPVSVMFKETTTTSPTTEPVKSMTMPTLISLGTICRNECSIQCDHQCSGHGVSGPKCVAACQTTCYPVCQAKLRRRMQEKTSEFQKN